MCLPQYYRTAEEQVFFKRAMANMHVLYAHRSVQWVFCLENLADESAKAFAPDFIDIYYEAEGAEPGSGKFGPQPFSKLELNETPYHERGWCEAEKQWMSTRRFIGGFAPMTPARFRERVERGHRNLPDGLVLKFTHRSDEEIVVKLQEKIFLQQAPRRKKLEAWMLREPELLFLSEFLPHFVNLRKLEFRRLEIQETSAVALIAGLKTLRHLKELDFSVLCDFTEKAGTVLAEGLLECQFAGDLRVTVPHGPEFGKLRLLKGTGRVDEKEEFCHVIFTIRATSRKFGWFGQQLAKLSTCCTRRAPAPPHATPDDAHVVAHV